MKKEIEKYIKNIDMNKTNITRKNIASILTISIELIKVILTLLYMPYLNTITKNIIFIYAIIASLLSFYIYINDDYKSFKKYILLDLSSLIFLLSNVISGILIETILFKADKVIIKRLTKDNKIKKLPLIIKHSKLIYAYLFINIIILYELPHYSTLSFSLYVLVSLLLFFIEDIKQSILAFKNNINKYLKYIFSNYAYMIIISGILFMIITFMVGNISTNEQLLNEETKVFLMLFGCIYAPIAEELLFRGCLRKLIKNDMLFIITSGISFGMWHVIGYDQSLIQYLYIIPYSAMGICLSYVYAKTNNLTTNIGIHFLNNLIATIF